MWVAGKCNISSQLRDSWATKSLNKWPLSHFALLSASELKIKTVKFRVFWFVFFSFHLRKEQDLEQLKNNHRTTTSVLSGLPAYGLHFVKVNSCFEDFIL